MSFVQTFFALEILTVLINSRRFPLFIRGSDRTIQQCLLPFMYPQFSNRWQIQSEGLRSRKSGMTIYTRGEGQVHHSPLTTGPSVATVASETHRESEEVLILCNCMS